MKVSSRGLLLLAVCVSFPAVSRGQNAEWESSFEAAQKKANETGKTLLVHFYADWCGPCRAMERSVFSSPQVKSALTDGIVAVKVNSDNRRDLVSRYGVTALPSDVFVDSKAVTP